MLIKWIMNFQNLLKIACILFIFFVACTTNQQINTANSCIIFEQKKIGINLAKIVLINGELLSLFN